MKFTLACFAALLGCCCWAAEFPVFVNTQSSGADRYCGLYCIYQAGLLTKHPVPLDTLIQPKRLKGKYGSSLSDLAESCTEFQIPHRYIALASYADLLLLDQPAIVLIKSAPESHVANHWVMLLETHWDSARVYDPSCGVLQVSAAELQSLWGGPVLLIEPENSTGNSLPWHITKVGLTVLVLLGNFALLRVLAAKHWYSLAILLGVPLVLAGIVQLADPASFYHNRSVVRQTAAVAEPRPFGFLAPVELLSRRSDYTVIDVRTPGQFEAQAIPGSVNIPYQSSFWKNRALLENYPEAHPLVLYCNSADCGWAEAMAKSSLLCRFKQVFVLDDGLSGYIDAKGPLGGTSK
jgi:rhodanese-related sulfurtransferase